MTRISQLAIGARVPWPGTDGVPEIAPKEIAPRIEATYECERGHAFAVVLALGAEVPVPWDCYCGKPARLQGAPEDAGEGHPFPAYTTPATGKYKRADQGKSPHDHLHERRSDADLEEILAESVAALRAQRGAAS
jgi:hypothetical protein